MSYTVQDIIDRTKAALDRSPVTSGPGAYKQSDWFLWIKDAYNEITDLCRIPRMSSTSITSTASTASYSLPTDIWDGIDGLISVTYNKTSTEKIPLERGRLQDLQDTYGSDYLAPPGISDPFWYIDYNDSTKFTLIPAPPASSKTIELVYVQQQSKPSATSDAVPLVFEPFVGIIPKYIIGRAMELDRQGRGAALVAEFKGELLRKYRKKERSRGRQSVPEGYSKGFDDYRQSLRRGRRI